MKPVASCLAAVAETRQIGMPALPRSNASNRRAGRGRGRAAGRGRDFSSVAD